MDESIPNQPGKSEIGTLPKSGVVTTLQAGRALAALAVVFYHCVPGTEFFVGEIPKFQHTLFRMGYLGVDFFFVLSGFIIYFSARSREKSTSAARVFVTKRLSRIFLPYLPVTLTLIAMYLLLPDLSNSPKQWAWMPSLFLLPVIPKPALVVAWTLQHELIFYLFFAFIYFTNNLVKGCLIWCGAIAAGFWFGFGEYRPWVFFFGLINLEFLFGVAAAALVLRLEGARLGKWIHLFWIASIAIFVLFFSREPGEIHRIIFGLGIAFLLVPIVKSELAGKIETASWFVFLGNASYAIYLIHTPVLSATSRIAGHWFDAWQFSVTLGILSSEIGRASCRERV